MTVKKILKTLLILLAVLLLLVVIWLVYMNNTPTVKSGYTDNIETGGSIEKTYLSYGSYETASVTVEAEKPMERYTVYYPSNLENGSQTYPVVLVTNGTGHRASKYAAMLERLASWGFIVVGNEDAASGTGKGASLTLEYILSENEDKNSRFYRKVDTENIGITGYSQGGAGAINAITAYENSRYFKTAVLLSPAQEAVAVENEYPYDSSAIHIPVLLLAGTSGWMETEYVLPLNQMEAMFDKISAPKLMARRTGAEHETMMYLTDGYTTAWLMYQLQGDQEASKAFVGGNAEICNNPYYQDQKCQISEANE